MIKILKKVYNRIVAWMNAPHMRRPMAAMLLLTAAIQMWAAGDGMSGIKKEAVRRRERFRRYPAYAQAAYSARRIMGSYVCCKNIEGRL